MFGKYPDDLARIHHGRVLVLQLYFQAVLGLLYTSVQQLAGRR